MIENIFSFLSSIINTVGVIVLTVVMQISSFFGFAGEDTTLPLVIDIEVATSSVPAISEITPTPVVIPKLPPKIIPPVVTPVVTPPPVITPPPVVPPIVTPPPVATTTQTVGTTTLSVRSVPLLVGGTVHAGETVSVSYLQITNIGKEGAFLKGFWVRQNGSAPGESIIGLSTVDDKGGSRGLNGGTEGALLFQNGLAFAPTDAFFAPSQMRLFTIKVIMTQFISAYLGTQLMIEVSSVVTTAATKDQQFPIRGTTWTIAE